MGKDIHILGEFNQSPVAVLSGHFLGLSFHPELDGINIFHQILFDPTSSVYYKKINQTYAA
jgi:glutamine amidotransferase PdxT